MNQKDITQEAKEAFRLAKQLLKRIPPNKREEGLMFAIDSADGLFDHNGHIDDVKVACQSMVAFERLKQGKTELTLVKCCIYSAVAAAGYIKASRWGHAEAATKNAVKMLEKINAPREN